MLTIPLPISLIIVSTATFLILERVFPGRNLPNSPGWYVRALMLNLIQLGITFVLGRFSEQIFSGARLFHFSSLGMPVLQGFIAYLIGTFIFYWWHRARHARGLWQVFHQIHHSPSRIEIFTSFYKHPLEIFVNSFMQAVLLFPILGVSIEGMLWYNFFAATGEYFYHANLKTPKWLRYIIQTPELHSIHHQLDVHSFNYSDLPFWDRIFGTYRDTLEFAERCGFPDGAERRVKEMLLFRDVYEKK